MNFNFGYWPPVPFSQQTPYQYHQYEGQSSSTQDGSNQINTDENQIELKNKSGRERWTEQQSMCLVQAWKENLPMLESVKANEGWLLTKAEVDKMGPPKTVKQCKVKIRNLKDNSKTGEKPCFPRFYDIFDEILEERDGTVPVLGYSSFSPYIGG